MKFSVNISRKGFTINRQPGQELQNILALMPRTSFDYQSQVNGYQSAIIMACIKWVQRTYPEAPLMLQRMNKEGQMQKVYDHAFLRLLDRPNEFYDGLLLQMGLIADFFLDGNAYIRKLKSEVGRVVQLWWVPSVAIEPKWPQDGSQFISHYNYKVGAYGTTRLLPDEVIHFRDGFDPDNIRKGMSSLKSLFREVFTDDEASNMTATLLKNLGVPGVVLSPSGGATATQEDAKATKEWFKESFTGDKRGEPLVMTSGTDVKMMGFSPKDMQMKELRRLPEERVSAVIGVPAIVAGLGAGLDRSTYANYAEAREAAYESTIIPLQRIFSSVLKRQGLDEFEDDVQFWNIGYDLSNVRILQEDENKRIERLDKMVKGGWLKVAAAQRESGMEVDDTQDIYLRPFNVVAVSSNGAAPITPMKQEKKNLMDEMGKENWWRGYVSKAENYEKNFISDLQKMFRSQEKESIANVKKGVKENLFDRNKGIKEYTSIATPILSDLMSDSIQSAKEMLNGHKDMKQVDLSNPVAILWLKTRIGWAAAEVGDTTAHLLAMKLSEGYAAGEGVPKLTKRVKEVFSHCEKSRAEMIARTETIQASAQGSIEGYKEVGVGRVEFYAALDERTCSSCLALHEQEFPINESQGIITVHPACRCTWLPVV